MTQVARQPRMMVAKLGPMPDFREFHSGTEPYLEIGSLLCIKT